MAAEAEVDEAGDEEVVETMAEEEVAAAVEAVVEVAAITAVAEEMKDTQHLESQLCHRVRVMSYFSKNTSLFHISMSEFHLTR